MRSMKLSFIISLLLLLAVASCQDKSHNTEQGRGELAWAASMLSTIEAEHLLQGDSVHLSLAYTVRMMLRERALTYVHSKGKKPITTEGNAPLLLHYLYQYGAQPYDSYEGKKGVQYNIVCRKLKRLCDTALAHRVGERRLLSQIDELLDNEMGYLPGQFVHMYGAEYTPKEFAHSVCYPHEYVTLSPATHEADAIVQHVKSAIRKGHPVCWESNDGRSLVLRDSLNLPSEHDLRHNTAAAYMSQKAYAAR